MVRGRVDVAGQRQVEDDERPARAARDGRQQLGGEDVPDRAGAGDDEVGLGESGRQLGQRAGLRAEGGGQPLGPVEGAVGDDDAVPHRTA